MVKNTIPKPPIQCEKLRQNNIPCESDSILSKIVAPVVVNPDTISKNASATEGIAPLIRKGSIPKAENRIQVNATMQYPSRRVNLFSAFLPKKTKSPPAPTVIKVE